MLQYRMIKVSKVVETMLQENEIALEACREGFLNFSSYAKKIKPEIEKKLYKKVKLGTIVTALSRLSLNLDNRPRLRPTILIEDLSIKASLCEISYDRTDHIINKINDLKLDKKQIGLFAITHGVAEISIIAPQKIIKNITQYIGTTPKGQYDNLVALTIRFDEAKYIEEPNMIYALLAKLASRRINIIEVVSTFTEISFIVRQKDTDLIIDALKNDISNY